jgi:hypothetical protein
MCSIVVIIIVIIIIIIRISHLLMFKRSKFFSDSCIIHLYPSICIHHYHSLSIYIHLNRSFPLLRERVYWIWPC